MSLRAFACGVLFAVVFVLAFGAGSAHAYGTVPDSGTTQWRYQFNPYPAAPWRATMADACQAFRDDLAVTQTTACGGGQCPLVVHVCNGTNAIVRRNYLGGITDYTATLSSQVVPGCPTDSSLVSGQCVCNSGFKPDAGACVALNCQAVRESIAGSSLQWTGQGASFCYGGCTMTAGVRGYLASTNTSSTSGQFITADSSSCQGALGGLTADGNDSGVSQPGLTCPVKQCPGTVNGATVCVPCSASTAQGPSSSASSPSGAASAPPIAGAPAGSVSSSEQTTCGLGKCTTTTTYRDAAGNVTGESTKEEQEQDFCAKNPNLSICKDSGISGACSAVTCTGDAIQCAMAKEQARRACEFFEATGAAVEAGNAAASAGDRPGDHPANSPDTLAFGGLIDQTDRLSGTCPADFSITVNGQAMAVPMSQLCSPLAMLGNVIVAVSLLAAVFIVFRG